ncbi:hypothetical protein [Microseira sp. BLCC-F43]|jgi:hypothetical protein|uniref:hypothetical protein n=1 Tax=Microseira sp. BLCC-F43 TaxID=3153602 RepID=UPI0035B6C7A6
MKIEVIKIDELRIHQEHLDIIYSADKFKFSTKVLYEDVCFSRLVEKYARQVIIPLRVVEEGINRHYFRQLLGNFSYSSLFFWR